jgi:hypothetical protein
MLRRIAGALLLLFTVALSGCSASSSEPLQAAPESSPRATGDPQTEPASSNEKQGLPEKISGHEHLSGDSSKMNDWDEAQTNEAESLLASWRSLEADATAAASVKATWAGWSYAEGDLEWVLQNAAARCQWTYDGGDQVLSDFRDVARGEKHLILPVTKFYCPDLMDSFLKQNNITPNWNAPAFQP